MAKFRSISFETYIVACLFLEMIILLSNYHLSHSHSSKNVVNFNDLMARLISVQADRADAFVLRYAFGDFEANLPITKTSLAPTLSKAISCKVDNQKPFAGVFFISCYGGLLIYDTKNQGRDKMYDPAQVVTMLVPTFNESMVWQLDVSSIQNLRTTIYCIGIAPKTQGGSGTKLVEYDIGLDPNEGNWKLIQTFDWQHSVYVCYRITSSFVAIIRFKPPPPDKLDSYASFLSAIVIDSIQEPSITFLPSYPTPMILFSREIIGPNYSFHYIDLIDIALIMDRGSVECETTGSLSEGFYDLGIFLLTGAKESQNTNCPKTIPFQFYNKSTRCFNLSTDFMPESLETYYLGYDFNLYVLAYIVDDKDFRCYVKQCGDGDPICISQTYDSEAEIDSTWWNADDFVLTRFDAKKNSTEISRLVDCEFFLTCPQCTLFGGFNCVWDSLACKDNAIVTNSSNPFNCFPNITGTQRNLTRNSAELTILLPFIFDKNLGEEAYVMVNGDKVDGVKFENLVYKVEVPTTEINSLIIVIKRGNYEMETYVNLSPENTSIKYRSILIFGILLILFVATVMIVLIITKRNQSKFPGSVDQEPIDIVPESFERKRKDRATDAMHDPSDRNDTSGMEISYNFGEKRPAGAMDHGPSDHETGDDGRYVDSEPQKETDKEEDYPPLDLGGNKKRPVVMGDGSGIEVPKDTSKVLDATVGPDPLAKSSPEVEITKRPSLGLGRAQRKNVPSQKPLDVDKMKSIGSSPLNRKMPRNLPETAIPLDKFDSKSVSASTQREIEIEPETSTRSD